MQFDEATVDRWRILLEDETANSAWMDEHRHRDERRVRVRKEILELREGFITGAVSLEDFRTTFDNKTRNEWEGFGFKGLSGAMFLNKLVKHISNHDELTNRLQTALALPADEQAGRDRMGTFLDFLKQLIRSGVTTKQLLQPARTPFFLSLWWHLQDTEQWPIYYGTARRTMIAEGVFTPAKDPIEDYLTFRERFRALATALDLSAWPFEHLCAWYDKHGPGMKDKEKGNGDEEEENDQDDDSDAGDNGDTVDVAGTSHTQAQWLLATIGRKLGCRIWIAKNDHSKEWNGKKLSDLSIQDLPNLGMGTGSQKVISLIDVLWLKGFNQVVAAFEVEHTTSVFSGLLRLADLTALAPNLFFPLYIVAPKERLSKVRKELARPTFQTLELHKRCGFFSCQKLKKEADNIMRWANDPAAIDKIAERVEDAMDEDVI